MNKTFDSHLSLLKEKLINNDPFSFSRFSDGELYILKNIELKLDENLIKIGDNISFGPYKKADFKHFDPSIHSFYQQKLVESFKFKSKNYFKGISCRCCVGDENFDYQIKLHGGDDDSLTWANLFVNSNYPKFINEMLPIFQTYNTIIICNESADISNLEFVVKDFRVGYNAMINDYPKIEIIKKWIDENHITGHLFLFSASSFSNLAIYELYKHNNSNFYIDIGTCLSPFINLPMERSYLQEYWFKIPGNDLKRVCIW